MRVYSHVWTAQATHGVDEGAGKLTKVQAMVQACAAVEKGVRVHETWPMVHARHR